MSRVRELVQEWYRDFLAEECMECEGKCCGLNIPGLSEEQIRLIFGLEGDLIPTLNSDGGPIFKEGKKSGEYDTNYAHGDMCPQCVDGRCQIYDHPLRPSIGAEFPIFVNDKHKFIAYDSHKCAAVHSESASILFLNIMAEGYHVSSRQA